MKNFDKFIGVDWSGAKLPVQTKSIAVASVSQGGDDLHLHTKIRSRDKVAEYIDSLIEENIQSRGRALIGIDCNFGYAQEIIHKQLGENATAFDLWARVDEVNAQNDNFFAGNFWQHTPYAKDFWTTGKMREGFNMPKRATEIVCAQNGYGNPESPFKLIGAKQVGKGGLAGMRMAYALKKRHGHKIAVYPFEGEAAYDKASAVVTEIYPRQFIMRAGMGNQKLRTIYALNQALEFFDMAPYNDIDFSDHDADALISAAGLKYLCGAQKNIPDDIAWPSSMSDKSKQCEGWIFGVGQEIC